MLRDFITSALSWKKILFFSLNGPRTFLCIKLKVHEKLYYMNEIYYKLFYLYILEQRSIQLGNQGNLTIKWSIFNDKMNDMFQLFENF